VLEGAAGAGALKAPKCSTRLTWRT
jgi:hypothetical protein